jgi:hypothetical protein
MNTTLLLGVHSHQPVDNFDHVVAEATLRSYRPFFEVAADYPDFRFSAHYSGWLLEFIQSHDPELFSLMQTLSRRGQIEWFTGGFYEPILASIPPADRQKQIAMLSDFIETHFGRRPRGLWLTERVYDGSIVGDLIEAGVEYVIVDDYHLLCTGLERDTLNGYYLTESGGKALGLFPISKPLRYQIPFWQHHEVIETLQNQSGAAVIFDDGEKFGVWPGTHEWVYEKGWLRAFIEGVLAHDRIKAGLYRDFFDQNPPLGVVYPPDVSYYEMGEWSLRPDDHGRLEHLKHALDEMGLSDEAERFTRGATWKNFLVKYTESGRIHRRMLALCNQRPKKTNPAFEAAIAKAQCNDVLWHGVFGGLYLPSLRDTAWRYLIEAESALKRPALEMSDWQMSGKPQLRLRSSALIAGFEPGSGGSLSELHIRSKRFNLLNTLMRRREAYHDKIAPHQEGQNGEQPATIHDTALSADEAAMGHLVFDRFVRHSFMDHLVDEIDGASLFEQRFCDRSDLSSRSFGVQPDGRGGARLSARAAFDGDPDALECTKEITLDKTRLSVQTTLKLPGDSRYLQMHNFHFANPDRVTVNHEPIEKGRQTEPLKQLLLYCPWLNQTLVLDADVVFAAYLHPVYTVSQSEAGLDCTCQQIAVGLVFAPAKTHRVTVSLTLKEGR